MILSAFDYAIFAVLLAVSTGIGVFFQFSSKKKTTEEYLLAGKDMSILPVAFSLMATFMSATTLMGIPAEMYLYGTNMAFMNIGFFLGPIITSYLLLPTFFAIDASTAYEYLEKRFGKITRRLISAMFAFQLILYTAAVLYAPALALSAVTDLSISMSVITIGVVCTFYCTLGGMKAVLWTDVFQAILMFVCLFGIIITGCQLLGGIENIFRIANEGGRLVIPRFTFNLEEQYSMFNVFALGMIITMSGYGGAQTQVQRLMTLKNLTRSKIATFISIPMLVAFHLLCCLCGLIIYAYFESCDPITSPDSPIHSPDQLMPLFITSTMSHLPGLPGLCICGIFSASLSTVSSSINSLAAVASQDFLKPIFPSLDVSVFHTKVISLFMGTLCIAFSFLIASIGNLIKINVIVVGLTAGPNLAVFLLASCTTTANEEGVILAIVASLAASAYLSFGPEKKRYPFLPLSNECPSSQSTEPTFSSFNNFTEIYHPNATTSSTITVDAEDESFHLSYMWISTIGLLACLVVGYFGSLVISSIRGYSAEVPEVYLSPIRTWFMKNSKSSERTQDKETNNTKSLETEMEPIERNAVNKLHKNQ